MQKVREAMKWSRPWLAPAVAIAATLLMVAPGTAMAGHEGHGWTDGDSYILLSSSDRGATMMSGSTDDLKRARALRSDGAPLLYLRRDGKTYVVRDAATLERARAIFKPQAELGKRQAALGAQQAELGSQQAELGRRQAQLSLRQISAGSRTDALGKEQGDIGRQQGELGDRQGKLGEQQGRLGREQERLGREARAKFRALVDEAMRQGLAKEVG